LEVKAQRQLARRVRVAPLRNCDFQKLLGSGTLHQTVGSRQTMAAQSRSSSQPTRAPRSWLRRILWGVLIAFLVSTAVFLIQYYWRLNVAQAELNDAIVKLDRKDARWRLEQIEADRKAIPDAENGALVVLDIFKSLPKGWYKEDILRDLDDYPPNRRLRE